MIGVWHASGKLHPPGGEGGGSEGTSGNLLSFPGVGPLPLPTGKDHTPPAARLFVALVYGMRGTTFDLATGPIGRGRDKRNLGSDAAGTGRRAGMGRRAYDVLSRASSPSNYTTPHL